MWRKIVADAENFGKLAIWEKENPKHRDAKHKNGYYAEVKR